MNNRAPFSLLLLLIAALFWLSPVNAEQSCTPKTATIDSIQGNVEIQRAETSTWFKASLEHGLCNGDVVKIHPQSRAVVYLQNNTVLRLDENTEVSITEVDLGNDSSVTLLQGIVHFISRTIRGLTIKTPYANAGVEGTEFVVKVSENTTEVIVFEGKVVTKNEFGEVLLTDNQSALVEAGKAPKEIVNIRPRDAVNWAMYFPPVIDADNKNATLQQAASLLKTGDVQQASKLLQQVLSAEPNNGDAKALQAIIAIVNNDNNMALKLTNEAVQAAPDSATSYIALSYALQSQMKLDQAIKSATTAVDKAPNNSLAWARLAELQLSIGQLNKALQSAEKANDLDSSNARSKMILGFAYLTQLKTSKARETFNQAIKLDQTDPLPRLGLGLAKIRDNQLKDGRREIEIAASLDPNNSLIRSYLGKAYYEEKRSPLDAVQFEMAKELDPNDPTPWLYDAIQKQADNKPVEALQNLQQSMLLNDNRAVYRSRLLLDEDQATRSANLARIYRDLGFNRLAQNESRKSLTFDPGNYSAHQFLADSYVNTPRHEIARVSELLQAKLLNPLITSPISPSAGEANLSDFQGTATSAGFNEYNSLFNSNDYALLLSGTAGKNKTRSGEITAGAFFNKGMISAGRYTGRSDGFRDNNDYDQTVDNVFAQVRPTNKLSIQGEYKRRDGEFGDLVLKITEKVDPIRRNITNDSKRIGFNYMLSQRHTFLTTINKQIINDKSVRSNGPILQIVDNASTRHNIDAQYLYSNRRIRLVAGVNYLNKKENTENILSSTSTELPFFDSKESKQNLDQKTAYLYSYLTLTPAILIVGTDYVDIDQQSGLKTWKFFPKFGVILNIDQQTTLRLATFRTIRTSLTDNQTLAPTQIAGFNQLYDNDLGSTAQRIGIGLDRKFTASLATGLEASWRILAIRESATRKERQTEQSHSAYINWTPKSYIATNLEFHFDSFERDYKEGVGRDRPAASSTNTVPLNIHFFHGSNWFSHWKSTYVAQSITDISSQDESKVIKDYFWITDISLGYRLSRRLGVINLSIRNLFKQNFHYQSTEPGTNTTVIASPYYPKLAFFAGLQLRF